MVILNKYRNALGRQFRSLYDRGVRNSWCRRSAMRSFQARPDLKSGTVNTMVNDNLLLELYSA